MPSQEIQEAIEQLNDVKDQVPELVSAIKPMATSVVGAIISAYTESPEFNKLLNNAYKIQLAKSFIEASPPEPYHNLDKQGCPRPQ